MVTKMNISSPMPVSHGLKVGIGEVIAIFWTIHDPPLIQGLKDGDGER